MNILNLINSNTNSEDKADFLSAILGEYQSEVLLGKLDVVLYGFGSAGKNLLDLFHLYNIPISCFCDSNENLVGQAYDNIQVVSLHELKCKHAKSLIVVASNTFRNEIRSNLNRNGLKKTMVIEDSVQLFFYTQFNKWMFGASSLKLVETILQEVYQLLVDDKSKKLFVSRLALFSGFPDYQAYRNYILDFSEEICLRDGVAAGPLPREYGDENNTLEDFLYFNNDVLQLDDNEVLLDAGAYDGGSSIQFIDTCKRKGLLYNAIYCVEADQHNFSKLQVKAQYIDRLACIPCGLWSRETNLFFVSSELVNGDTAKIINEEELSDYESCEKTGIVQVKVNAIDNLFSQQRISFIKMDIEGAEYEALLGARETIKRYKPKLAISIYHNKEDIYRIPFLLHQICPEYKLSLRQFSNHLSEMVLLATCT